MPCVGSGHDITFGFILINDMLIGSQTIMIKVEYHANENPLKNSEKIAYVGQRLMYPIMKKEIIPYHTVFTLK